MATIQRIQKSRKSKSGDRHCDACRKVIEVGGPYKWYRANRFAPLLTRCVDCPDWLPSEMEPTNLSIAYAAQENAHEALDTIDTDSYWDDDRKTFDATAFIADVSEAVRTAAEGAQECADAYQESFDNIPESLQQGPTAEELQEKIDTLESWSSDLDGWDSSEVLDVEPEDDAYIDAVVTFAEAVISEARDAVDGLEL